MPHCKPEALRPVDDRWPNAAHGFRSEQWGDMEIGFTKVDAAIDCAPMYRTAGLAGGVCQCPHYGYVFKGRMRASYPDTGLPDEVINAGEVYFIPAGHTLAYDEPSEVLELNPAHALQQLMTAFERALGPAATD